jgi:hypothetical protein
MHPRLFYLRIQTLLEGINSDPPHPFIIQGGSDKSGTISELHQCIKNIFFLLIFLLKSVLAVCRSVNKNKQTHLGKDESTGSDSSHDSLQASRRMYLEKDYEL